MSRTPGAMLCAAALTATLSACNPAADTAPSATSNRSVADDVTVVEMRGGGSLTIEPGDEASLAVTAPAAIIDEVLSEVEDGVLTLERTGAALSSSEVNYALVLPQVEEIGLEGGGSILAEEADGDSLTLQVEGSGRIEVAQVDVLEVTAEVEGSGEIQVAGTTDLLDVGIEGSGSYEGDDLTAAEAVVVLAGSGRAQVRSTVTLDAQVRGSGDVRYAGDPEVTSSVSGSGSVEAS